jgi:hypothetical protein
MLEGQRAQCDETRGDKGDELPLCADSNKTPDRTEAMGRHFRTHAPHFYLLLRAQRAVQAPAAGAAAIYVVLCSSAYERRT